MTGLHVKITQALGELSHEFAQLYQAPRGGVRIGFEG
jgi:hypothetical protein